MTFHERSKGQSGHRQRRARYHSPGERAAVVGRSGAGKTAILSLLPRFFELDGGRIMIGEHDIRDLPQEDLRRLLTLGHQDAFLLSISPRENIRLGLPDATDAQVEAAARGAPGGQRQRIAIALLRDAPILIMALQLDAGDRPIQC